MTTTTMDYQDIMTYLRKHGDALQKMVDDKFEGGFAKRITALRSGDEELRNDSIEFFQHIITLHNQTPKKGTPKTRQKWGRDVADDRSYLEKWMDSKPVQTAVHITNIFDASDDFKELGHGIRKTAAALKMAFVGPIQISANLLAIGRKAMGMSDFVWNSAASAVILWAGFYNFYQEIDITPANTPKIETHGDDFCANPANLHGDALTAAFSRANFDPRADKHSHYLSAMQGTAVGIPPVALMMIQAMETAFIDVQGSRSVTLDNGKKIVINADAQGLYQNQTVDFLERVMKYGADLPIYKDLKIKEDKKTLSDVEGSILHSLDKMMVRLKGTSAAERKAIANGLKDGSMKGYEAQFMSLRYHSEYSGQLMGKSFLDRYPALHISNLPKDPVAQLNAVKMIIYDIYQDHLMGENGAYFYNKLAQIPALKISDTKNAQARINQFGNSYNLQAALFVKQAEQNPGPFKGYDTDMTFAEGLKTFHAYVDKKTAMVTTPLETFLSGHKGAKNAFEICAKDIQSAKLQQPLKATRIKVALKTWGFGR